MSEWQGGMGKHVLTGRVFTTEESAEKDGHAQHDEKSHNSNDDANNHARLSKGTAGSQNRKWYIQQNVL